MAIYTFELPDAKKIEIEKEPLRTLTEKELTEIEEKVSLYTKKYPLFTGEKRKIQETDLKRLSGKVHKAQQARLVEVGSRPLSERETDKKADSQNPFSIGWSSVSSFLFNEKIYETSLGDFPLDLRDDKALIKCLKEAQSIFSDSKKVQEAVSFHEKWNACTIKEKEELLDFRSGIQAKQSRKKFLKGY